MTKNSDPKVPFTSETITICLCPGCPVQTSSQCVSMKLEKMDEAVKSAPQSDEVPGVYCSTGVATCKDLDPKQMCICGTCAVWQEYKLVSGKPVYYFCQNGRAQ